MDNIKNTRKNRILLILRIVFIMIVLVLASLFVSRSVSKRIIDENIETIKEMALHDRKSVNNSLELRYEVLDSIGDSLKSVKIKTVQEMQLQLQDKMVYIPGAKELFLVDDDGKIYKNTGLIAYEEDINEMCGCHWDRFVERYNTDSKLVELRQEMLLLAVPADLSVQDTHFKYIMAVMDIDTIETELKIDSYGGAGASSIIDVDGNYIVNINKNHSFLTYDNYFEDVKDVEFNKHNSLQAILAEADATGFSFDVYEMNGKKSITVITTMPEVNWYLITTVPMSVFSEQTNRIMNVIYALIAVILMVVVFVVLLLMHQKKQSFQLVYAQERAKSFETIEKQNKQLADQHEALENALALAQSANRAKTTFLNNMSHDIRTPMNAIIGYTGLAVTHIYNKELVQDYLSKISQSSEHLLSLINDVLDMSRIESGKMNLEEKEENLSNILHTLRNIVQADIHNKELEFFIDTDVDNEYIVCDKLRLNQVLLNILSNSIKYTHTGGTVSLRMKQKGVNESGYGMYEIRIKDNGMGMSEEYLKHIFEPFTRVKSSTVSGIQGTGLGMAITKNIVDMMCGHIEIESEEGKGTEVILKFEFKLADEKNDPVNIAELEGLRGLVVDDDTSACMSISKMLRNIGMRSEWCASGREAVIRTEEAMQIGDFFKVYIIDWQMPDMNGVEVARRIRRIAGEDAPIILLTAYDWSDIEEEARQAGVAAFISKPMFMSDLHNVLLKCCSTGEQFEEPEQEEYNFAGKKVLLVEDNEINREIAIAILEEDGFVIDTAEDGSIAVEKMKLAQPGQYDFVLMDVQMPIMDGYEATRRIRALTNPEVSNIPIIAMTANAFEEDRQAALNSGMNDHIPKPIDVKLLKETIARYV